MYIYICTSVSSLILRSPFVGFNKSVRVYTNHRGKCICIIHVHVDYMLYMGVTLHAYIYMYIYTHFIVYFQVGCTNNKLPLWMLYDKR